MTEKERKALLKELETLLSSSKRLSISLEKEFNGRVLMKVTEHTVFKGE